MKSKKIITSILSTLTVSVVFLSGLMKFIHLPWSMIGLERHNPSILGLMEMTFIVLFAFPKTMKIGFILLNCYFAGAMATELYRGQSMFNPAVPLILIWICGFLRDKSLFIKS
ncbi:DoxX family protein [Flavobacterium hungaricum]|uniref:DoxX family protein n=1 Tax=Flavobacterium hungaricum TaxID=2082725 RepID=A0ABR9THJ8_9FLAO|nr:DoxX family protein [Flavobacterium hungaricum]MBE8724504.1 DoxX family protein [Flavobacterium hungaricum]